MKDRFFRLENEESCEKFETYDDFAKRLNTSKHLCNLSYWPDRIESITIRDTTFENFSFSKTTISKITFQNCKFENCLFIYTDFIESRIFDCTFRNCNFFRATFKKTYAKPSQFKEAITDRNYANIAVQLFNQLRNVYKDDSQREYKAEAEFLFYKWKRIENYKKAQKNKAPWYKYTPQRVGTALYGFFFGFGYRLRNLLATTFATLIGLISINHVYSSEIFINPTEPTIIKSIYFTITTMATLGASGVPGFTEKGYLIVVIDVLIGISLLSVTINSIFKKVLK